MSKNQTADDFITKLIEPFMGTPERVLVAGSRIHGARLDRRTLYDGHVVGVDIEDGPGVDRVANLEEPFIGHFDHVDCCSMLEHCQRPWKVAQNLEQSLDVGGSIVVCVPFVWRNHAYPSDYWRITCAALPVLFPRIVWSLNCYIVNGKIQKMVKGINHNNKRYMERAQVLAFGSKI